MCVQTYCNYCASNPILWNSFRIRDCVRDCVIYGIVYVWARTVIYITYKVFKYKQYFKTIQVIVNVQWEIHIKNRIIMKKNKGKYCQSVCHSSNPYWMDA